MDDDGTLKMVRMTPVRIMPRIGRRQSSQGVSQLEKRLQRRVLNSKSYAAIDAPATTPRGAATRKTCLATRKWSLRFSDRDVGRWIFGNERIVESTAGLILL